MPSEGERGTLANQAQDVRDEPFGRQLRPVRVTITDGDEIDRKYWRGRLEAILSHQPCCTNHFPTTKDMEAFTIYPDANND